MELFDPHFLFISFFPAWCRCRVADHIRLDKIVVNCKIAHLQIHGHVKTTNFLLMTIIRHQIEERSKEVGFHATWASMLAKQLILLKLCVSRLAYVSSPSTLDIKKKILSALCLSAGPLTTLLPQKFWAWMLMLFVCVWHDSFQICWIFVT